MIVNTKERDALRAVLAELESPQLKLVDYVEHRHGCRVDGNGDPPFPCTCGLDTLLAASAETPATPKLVRYWTVEYGLAPIPADALPRHEINGWGWYKAKDVDALLETLRAEARPSTEQE